MMRHKTKFSCKRFNSSEDMLESQSFWKQSGSWWCITIQSLVVHQTLQLMLMSYPIKFGCRKISSSADMVETVISDEMSPHCDPELQDIKLIFLHDTFGHNVASSYQVWLKVQQLRRYHPDEHSLEFSTFSVTLTLTTTAQSNLFTRQSTLWWWAIKPSSVAKGSAVQIIY